MIKGFKTFGLEKLKEYYSNQCSPCIIGYPECKGDTEKAENWECPRFHNGLMIVEVD